jgi:hypothetical protein
MRKAPLIALIVDRRAAHPAVSTGIGRADVRADERLRRA